MTWAGSLGLGCETADCSDSEWRDFSGSEQIDVCGVIGALECWGVFCPSLLRKAVMRDTCTEVVLGGLSVADQVSNPGMGSAAVSR